MRKTTVLLATLFCATMYSQQFVIGTVSELPTKPEDFLIGFEKSDYVIRENREYSFWGGKRDFFRIDKTNLHSINQLRKLDFYDVVFTDTFLLRGIYIGELRMQSCLIDYLEIDNCTFRKNAQAKYNNFKQLNIIGTIFWKDLDLSNSQFETLSTRNTFVYGKINLSNMSVSQGGIIDLTGISAEELKTNDTLISKHGKIKINLTGAPLDRILINFEKFTLDFDSIDNYETRSGVYYGLLANFKRRGYERSYEAVDIEFQHFKNTYNNDFFGYLKDQFQRLWWNYGYSKWYIVIWTIVLLLLFSFINLFFFNYLNNKVYKIDNFKPRISGSIFKNATSKLYYSFIYTSVIFFSINLNLDKLNYNDRKSLSWFFCIYITGIICLGYLANFILKSE